jgi:hypothetical protein
LFHAVEISVLSPLATNSKDNQNKSSAYRSQKGGGQGTITSSCRHQPRQQEPNVFPFAIQEQGTNATLQGNVKEKEKELRKVRI